MSERRRDKHLAAFGLRVLEAPPNTVPQQFDEVQKPLRNQSLRGFLFPQSLAVFRHHPAPSGSSAGYPSGVVSKPATSIPPPCSPTPSSVPSSPGTSPAASSINGGCLCRSGPSALNYGPQRAGQMQQLQTGVVLAAQQVNIAPSATATAGQACAGCSAALSPTGPFHRNPLAFAPACGSVVPRVDVKSGPVDGHLPHREDNRSGGDAFDMGTGRHSPFAIRHPSPRTGWQQTQAMRLHEQDKAMALPCRDPALDRSTSWLPLSKSNPR